MYALFLHSGNKHGALRRMPLVRLLWRWSSWRSGFWSRLLCVHLSGCSQPHTPNHAADYWFWAALTVTGLVLWLTPEEPDVCACDPKCVCGVPCSCKSMFVHTVKVCVFICVFVCLSTMKSTVTHVSAVFYSGMARIKTVNENQSCCYRAVMIFLGDQSKQTRWSK